MKRDICIILIAIGLSVLVVGLLQPAERMAGISGGSSGITSATQLIRSGTDVSLRDITWELGIGSSTPNAQLSIGDGNSSSTIMVGKFCMYAKDEAGNGYYIYIPVTAGTVIPGQLFATSSKSCL